MKIFNSNISNELIQDLGPFKVKNADMSIHGTRIWKYKNLVNTEYIGNSNRFGVQIIIGTKFNLKEN